MKKKEKKNPRKDSSNLDLWKKGSSNKQNYKDASSFDRNEGQTRPQAEP